MAIGRKNTRKLLEELAAIDSVNPTLAPAAGRPGVVGEQPAAKNVREFLRANGVAAELSSAAFAKRWLAAIFRSFFARFLLMRERIK
ncbi:MAG: hypothetical protein ACYDDI_01425 [Candidatus Acidiferrales bacterium]